MASYRIYHDLINDIEVWKIPKRKFWKKFTAALHGEQNELSKWIKREAERPLANEWRIIRERIFARDDYTCAYCGERGGKLQCDHIEPVSRGGSHSDENLTTACEPCNRSKGAKTLEEWRR